MNPAAIALGIFNFKTNNQNAKLVAEKRLLENCISCPHFIDEPIDFLRVTDSEIPELSNKMCGDCGCVLAYKTRQSIDKCKLWV